MKKTIAKMTLKSETVRSLSVSSMARVHGGATENTGSDWCSILCTLGRFCADPTDGCPSVGNSPEC